MKAELILSQELTEEVADKIIKKLTPILLSDKENNSKDTIFDVIGLAEYLHIDKSWIYKQVSLRTIPFFKAGKYTRFRKSDIEKWIQKNIQKPVLPIKLVDNFRGR